MMWQIDDGKDDDDARLCEELSSTFHTRRESEITKECG